MDTGSSDLWLDVTGFTLPNVKISDVNVTLPYAYVVGHSVRSLCPVLIWPVFLSDGSVATGPISYGEVTFGNFTVENQAFGRSVMHLITLFPTHFCSMKILSICVWLECNSWWY